MAIEALIDGDLVAYPCAASAEAEEASIALVRCDVLLERIISAVGASSYSIYLSGDNNFRKEIDPSYKAHRKDKPKPRWLQDCREFLVKEWQAKVTDGIEADDALGIAQREDTFICSFDKDLLQVPGMHYNWNKDEEYLISEEKGLYNFWTQMIVGDVADNIVGVRGLGIKKAAKILDPIFMEDKELNELDKSYYDCVSSLYNDTERLHRNAKLLWILRQEGGVWQPQKMNGQQDV